MGQHWQACYHPWKRVYTFLKPLQQYLRYGKLMVKIECQGSEHVLPLGADPTTAQECVWTDLKEEYGSWKGIIIDFKSFYEDRRAQWRHLLSVPVHREKKTCKTSPAMQWHHIIICFWRHFATIIFPSRFSHGDLFEWRCSSFFCCLIEIVDFQDAAVLSSVCRSVLSFKTKKWGETWTLSHLRRQSYTPHQTAP